MTLYVMLVGAYPFEDPADPRNFRKTIQVLYACQPCHNGMLSVLSSLHVNVITAQLAFSVQACSMQDGEDLFL